MLSATTLQLITNLEAKRTDWLVQSLRTRSFSGDPNHSRGVADGILIAIAVIKESCDIPDTTPIVHPLLKLAAALSARATDINCGHDHTQDAALRRSMVVIYKGIADEILAALK